MSHPRLRTRRHKGGEPGHPSVGGLSEATHTCTRRFRRVIAHRSSRGRAARAAMAPGVTPEFDFMCKHKVFQMKISHLFQLKY
jgi:hypothetical protein